MSGNALFMIHESAGGVFGNKKIVAKLHSLLMKIDKILETTFNKASSINLTEIRKLMDDETFLTAEEALERGLIDTITDDSDIEPHISPDDNIENSVEDIYKRHAKDFETDASSFDDISQLIENELAPDNFSLEPFRPSGEFDYNELSISNLPCVDNGVVNINGLRYLNARLPVTLMDDKKRLEVQTWTKLAEEKFDEQKASGKYRNDNLPFRTILEVDVAGKPQTFIQTTEDIQMNALILNALGVDDESQVLEAIAKLRKDPTLAPVSSIDDPVTLPLTPAAGVPTGTAILATSAPLFKKNSSDRVIAPVNFEIPVTCRNPTVVFDIFP